MVTKPGHDLFARHTDAAELVHDLTKVGELADLIGGQWRRGKGRRRTMAGRTLGRRIRFMAAVPGGAQRLATSGLR